MTLIPSFNRAVQHKRPCAPLTDYRLKAIREMPRQGMKPKVIDEELGMTVNAVYLVIEKYGR